MRLVLARSGRCEHRNAPEFNFAFGDSPGVVRSRALGLSAGYLVSEVVDYDERTLPVPLLGSASPCVRAFLAERRLPVRDFGPVLLLRIATICSNLSLAGHGQPLAALLD